MHKLSAETFINKWWSSSASLTLDIEEWMEESCSNPETFWKEVVFSEQEKILPTSQSILGKTYNFYDDCIFRHLKSNSIAYTIFKGKDQTENWSFEKLHYCVNFHVDKWSYHSPQPGQLIVIIVPPGIHLLISLLTALRFGLKICYLPTNSSYLGHGQITKFLSQLNPQFIAAEDNTFALSGIPLLTMDENGMDEENHAPHSFAYPATSDIQISLSLHQQEPLTLVALDAHTIYLNALRDALFTLNLIQHPYWTSPLSCPIATEPCSTLMSLLCGINRLHVPDEVIKKDPLILQDERINLLGLSSSLQKLWSQKPGVPTRSLKCCYKSPLDVNHQSWKTFVQLNKLEKIPTFYLLMDSSIGGISLFSKPTTEAFNFLLKPTLSTAWSLNDISRSGQKALSGFGIFNIHLPASEKEPTESNFTSSQIEKNLMLTGFVEPGREGVTFPLFELEEIVNELTFVEDCMIHPILKVGMVFSRFYVLLIFVDPMIKEITKENKEAWSSEISQKVIDHLGKGFLPDQIEFFPLLPKKDIIGIHRAWCANQFNSGLFAQKQEIPYYQTLSILKKLVQKTASQM